jgi:hypothetical protein
MTFPFKLPVFASPDCRDQDDFGFIPIIPTRTQGNLGVASRPSESEAWKKGTG